MSNYELEHKLEHVYALAAYAEVEKKPVNSKNCQRILEKQNKRVHELMKAAYEIPFYRARFEQSGTTPDDYHCAEDLYKFPLLTKDELRDWMDEEAAKDPEKYKYWHVSPTSGSTGRPLRVLISPKEYGYVIANWLRTMGYGGFNPFTGKTMCRPNSLHGAVKEFDSPVQKAGILRRKYMSDTIKQRVDTQTLVDEINAYKPDYLYNHKNLLMRIAKYVKENDLYIHQPSFYTPFGEMLDNPSRALLIDVFGLGLIDAYGMGETGSCVIRIPGKKYYQVNSDLFVVNVYNQDLTGPALKGMMVITPLYKTELPLINYTSFDHADSYMKKGLRFVRGVQGRMNDVIHHRDGRVTEWGNISGVVNYIPDIISYRMVQETYEDLTLMMVRNPDTPVEKQAEIEAFLEEKLMAMFKDPSIRITYQWLDEIPVDPNGKLRVIISKVKPGAIGEPEHAGEDVGSAAITPDDAPAAEEAAATEEAPAEAEEEAPTEAEDAPGTAE